MWRKLKHLSLFLIGWICVLLGILGVLLPVMPGTVFFILAALCFAESSPRFHHMLMQNPWIGPALQNWEQHHAIQPTLKRTILLIIILAMLISFTALWGKIQLQLLSVAIYLLLLWLVSRIKVIPS